MATTVGYASLQVIPSFKGFAGLVIKQSSQAADEGGNAIEKGLGGAGDSAGRRIGARLSEGFGKAREALGSVVGEVGAVAIAAGGIGKAIEQNANKAKIQAALGLSPSEATAAAKVSGGLYAKGWGESLDDVNGALVAVKRNLGTAASGAELQGLTKQALAFSDAFGLDANESVNAVAQMLRTGLAKNAKQAFDIIATGEQTGADKAGDLLDTLNEYGTQFRKLGINGKTALGLINQGLQAGARDSDIVADALKEFSIRAVDGSKTTSAGFKLLGLNAKSMSEQIGKGGTSASAGLDTVLTKLRGIKDPVKQSQAAVDLFGTQAEDLGKALYALDPATATAGKGMSNVDGAAKRVTDAMGRTKSPIDQLKRGFEQALGSLAQNALPVLKPVLDWAKDAGPLLAKVAIGFAGLVVVNKSVGAIKSTASAIGDTVSVARKGASGVAAFAKGIGRVGQGFKSAQVAESAFSGKAGSAGGALRKAFNGGVTGAKAIGTGLKTASTALASAGKSALTFAANMAKAGVAAAATATKTVAVKVAQLAVAAATKVWAAVQWILDAAMNANPLGLIVLAIAALVAIVIIAWKNSETFRKIVIGAWNGIKIAAVAVWGFITRLLSDTWNAIKTAATTVWVWLKTFFVTLFNGYKTTFLTIWNAIKTAILAVWNAITTAASAVWGALKTYFTTIFNAYRTIILAVWNAIKKGATTVWAAIVSVVKAAVDRVKSTINGIKSIVSAVTGFFQSAYNGAKGKLNTLVSFVRGIPGKITGYFSGLWSKMSGIGGNIVAGLKAGISNAWHNVTDFIRSMVDRIPKVIREKLGIASPSKVMIDLFRWVPAGAAAGIDSGVALVERAADRVARAAVVAAPVPAAASAGSPTSPGAGTGRRGVNIENFYANNQSPAEIASELDWADRGRG